LVNYKKYQGVSLTDKGKLAAKMIVRKQGLWEVFLIEKLDFSWDEVHYIAEQLEHIKSEKLINKLDDFLGNPATDPHGDPIPNAEGQILKIDKQLLSELFANQKGICVGVKDTFSEFLKYLDKQKIALGSKIEILSKESFDLSFKINVDGKGLTISNKIASNLFVETT
jgi:DtxR family Mn-dependent transcriptional regulator